MENNSPTKAEIIVGGIFILVIIVLWAICPGGLP